MGMLEKLVPEVELASKDIFDTVGHLTMVLVVLVAVLTQVNFLLKTVEASWLIGVDQLVDINAAQGIQVLVIIYAHFFILGMREGGGLWLNGVGANMFFGLPTLLLQHLRARLAPLNCLEGYFLILLGAALII